jgi:hypothetical protein
MKRTNGFLTVDKLNMDVKTYSKEELNISEIKKNGEPLEGSGYRLSVFMMEMSREELITEILSTHNWDYMLENEIVVRFDEKELCESCGAELVKMDCCDTMICPEQDASHNWVHECEDDEQSLEHFKA